MKVAQPAQGHDRRTPAALAGQSPCLMIRASATLGTIHLRMT